MTSILSYLLKLSVSLGVLYLFYQVVLRRLTFYNWNRWYLLVYSLLSFFIPFINVYPVLEKNNWSSYRLLEFIPAVGYQPVELIEEVSNPWTFQDWVLLCIGMGITVLLVRLFIQQLSFFRIRRSSKLIIDDTVKVYQVDKDIIPFSYGNSIFVNQHQHNQEELKEIIRHEFVHVKQKHTMDILWCECLCMLNWYNPFAWLIRQSVRQNLEFIADSKVLQNGIDKKEYQYLLLKVIGISHFSIAPQFNFSSLKKRIAMMNKMKSARVHLIKFIFLLPLMVILLLAFRKQQHKDPGQQREESHLPFKDTIPSPPKRPARPVKVQLPEGVSSIQVEDNMATVKKENGQEEKYNLEKSEEKSAFVKKYGELPVPPPPPVPSPASPKAPQAPPPALVVNSKGYINSIADNNGECIVIIKSKAGKLVKAIELTEWNKREKQYVEEYGEIPPPPPPKQPGPSVPPVNGRVEVVPAIPVAPVVPPPGIDHGVIIAPSQEKIPVKPATKTNNPIQPVISVKSVITDPDVLFIIDGVEQPKGENSLDRLIPGDIDRIDVLKDESAIKIYGEKGSHGVVLITTKTDKLSSITNEPITVKGEKEGSSIVTLKNLEGFDGIILIDGVETKKADINEQLKLQNIESVNVWKGEKAIERFGDKGKKGVIEIKTKKKSITTT